MIIKPLSIVLIGRLTNELTRNPGSESKLLFTLGTLGVKFVSSILTKEGTFQRKVRAQASCPRERSTKLYFKKSLVSCQCPTEKRELSGIPVIKGGQFHPCVDWTVKHSLIPRHGLGHRGAGDLDVNMSIHDPQTIPWVTFATPLSPGLLLDATSVTWTWEWWPLCPTTRGQVRAQ